MISVPVMGVISAEVVSAEGAGAEAEDISMDTGADAGAEAAGMPETGAWI